MSSYQRSPKGMLNASRTLVDKVDNTIHAAAAASAGHIFQRGISAQALGTLLAYLAADTVIDRSDLPEDPVGLLGVTVKCVFAAGAYARSLDDLLNRSGVLTDPPSGLPGLERSRNFVSAAFAIQGVAFTLDATDLALRWMMKFPPLQPGAPWPAPVKESPRFPHSDQMLEVHRAMLRAERQYGIEFQSTAGDDATGGIYQPRSVAADSAINLVTAVSNLSKMPDADGPVDTTSLITGIQATLEAAEGFQVPARTMAQAYRDLGYGETGEALDNLAALIQGKPA